MAERVFLEGTSTFVDRQVGGIHRVVRRIVEELPSLHEEFGIESTPVVLRAGRLRDARTTSHGPAPSTSRFARACGWAAECLMARNAIAWRDTDLLLLLDASWGKRIWPAVRQAKKKGAAIGVMIHDLIPVHYPQFFPAKLAPMFRKWLEDAIRHADFFLCNSQATLRDLEQYLQHAPGLATPAAVHLDTFRLGADLPQIATEVTEVQARDDLRSFFTAGTNCYLSVCTIEPRKNHTYLLDAFECVWQTSPDTRLCIAGKVGWGCEHVLARIRNHPRYGKSLVMFHDLSDAELYFCYRHAKAFIFPSIVEGFGLPIVEALRHGLRVLASDTPVHREVGEEHCQYFPLDDVNSLVRMVSQIDRELPRGASRRISPRVVTWEQSSRELLTKSLRMGQRARGTWNGCRRAAA